MLHAFDDASGEELWAFIPPDLLNRLKQLSTATPGIFVDGSPRAYVTYDTSGNVTKAILIFGLRRGGNYYYALDVTTPTAPKYLWKIYNGKGGLFKELGQTWSNPAIGKIPWKGRSWSPFRAGYDEGQDDTANPPPDDIGKRCLFCRGRQALVGCSGRPSGHDLFDPQRCYEAGYGWGRND
jgi:type IV pilus assembly protein PilY1